MASSVTVKTMMLFLFRGSIFIRRISIFGMIETVAGVG